MSSKTFRLYKLQTIVFHRPDEALCVIGESFSVYGELE